MHDFKAGGDQEFFTIWSRASHRRNLFKMVKVRLRKTSGSSSSDLPCRRSGSCFSYFSFIRFLLYFGPCTHLVYQDSATCVPAHFRSGSPSTCSWVYPESFACTQKGDAEEAAGTHPYSFGHLGMRVCYVPTLRTYMAFGATLLLT